MPLVWKRQYLWKAVTAVRNGRLHVVSSFEVVHRGSCGYLTRYMMIPRESFVKTLFIFWSVWLLPLPSNATPPPAPRIAGGGGCGVTQRSCCFEWNRRWTRTYLLRLLSNSLTIQVWTIVWRTLSVMMIAPIRWQYVWNPKQHDQWYEMWISNSFFLWCENLTNFPLTRELGSFVSNRWYLTIFSS